MPDVFLHMIRRLLGMVLVVIISACGQPSGPAGPASRGEELYSQPFPDGNTFSCATCHALFEPAEDGFRRPGHPIGDAAQRPIFKGGRLTSFREAVNVCIQEWMRAEPLEQDDPRWIELSGFLRAQSGDEAVAPLELQIVAPPTELSGGDLREGEEIFSHTCAVCHGEGASGTQQAPSLIGEELDRETIARRIRTSGLRDSRVYENLSGGRMPFWQQDRLSDDELLHVVAYVEDIARQPVPDAGFPNIDASMGGDGGRDCPATHSQVGKTAVLSSFSHDVAGTARIINDCTIVIEDFHFDGGGINVQIYGGRGGEYAPPTGFSLTDNLIPRRFAGETFAIQLPAEVTLDSLDGISVWCVPIGVSFGDGIFE